MGNICGGGARNDRVAPNRPAAAPATAPAAAPAAAASAPPSTRDFVKALKRGDLAAVVQQLDGGAPLEHRGMWENTPLLVACHYGHDAVALELLRRGADAAAANEQGCTALLYACVEGMDGVLDALLAAPALAAGAAALAPPPAPVYSKLTDATAPRTPLHAAAENGFGRAVAALRDRGVATDAAALELAAAQGHADVCLALLLGGGGGGGDCGGALLAAAAGGHAEAAEAIALSMRRAGDGGGDGIGAALRAAASQCAPPRADAAADAPPPAAERIVSVLCDAAVALGGGVDAADDATGATALMVAAGRGAAGAVAVLLAAGADARRADAGGHAAAALARLAGHDALATSLEEAAGAPPRVPEPPPPPPLPPVPTRGASNFLPPLSRPAG